MIICYFGIYDRDFSRNRIYMRGLRELGHTVIECNDRGGGRFSKFVRLHRQLRALNDEYDVVVVGYPGHVVVPLARLASKRPVVADLLGSLEDAGIHSHFTNIYHRAKNRIVDYFAIHFAHVVLTESRAQRDYLTKRFGCDEKYAVQYTGADEAEFYCPESAATEREECTVVFRGKLTPESGIMHILRAAELLKDERIHFRIIGSGYLKDSVGDFLKEHRLTKVEWIEQFLPFSELRARFCDAQISLGQFESNPRLDRTIPHKAFEAMSMGLLYVTARSPATLEVFEDGETCLLVDSADPAALSETLRTISRDRARAREIALRAHEVFKKNYSTRALGISLVNILQDAISKA